MKGMHFAATGKMVGETSR